MELKTLTLTCRLSKPRCTSMGEMMPSTARTLRGVAIQWFFSLPSRGTRTFSDLVTLFTSQFAANRAKKLEVIDLFNIKQMKDENLKKYLPGLTVQQSGSMTKTKSFL
ncbi:hypothetical protein CR513_15537, partial [Mucuna pruriens]